MQEYTTTRLANFRKFQVAYLFNPSRYVETTLVDQEWIKIIFFSPLICLPILLLAFSWQWCGRLIFYNLLLGVYLYIYAYVLYLYTYTIIGSGSNRGWLGLGVGTSVTGRSESEP